MRPWFEKEQSITEFKEPVVYKGLEINVRKTNVKPPYIATVKSPATGKEVIQKGGNTEQEALDSAKQAVDKRESDAPKISAGGQTSVLLNTPSNDELLKDPSMYNNIYAKISKDRNGPTLVIGNELYGAADLEADGFVRSYDRRRKSDSEEALPQVMFNASNKFLSQVGIKMNGRYTLDTEGKYRDDNEHTVYPLQFQGSTVHAGDKLRMNRPALTIGATREDVQPWFQREFEEADIIKFPEPKAKVVTLPNVQSYPDFLTGVKDLYNRKAKGEISQDSHDKLYQDLIHRFMKKESFDTPWFLREDQKKLDYINKVLSSQPDIMDRIFKQLRIVDKKNVAKGYKQGDDEFDPRQYLDPKLTAPEDDYDSRGYRAILIKALTQASGTMEEVEAFLKNYGKVSYINVDILKTENELVPTTQFLKEAPGVSKGFVESMYNYLFRLKPDRGPGEIALAFMSPQIEIVGKGDLRIGGTLTEAKGQVGKKGGRFKDKTTSFGMPNLKFLEKEVDLPPELRISKVEPFTGSARQVSGRGKINVFTHAQKLEKAKPGLGQEFIQQMIAGTYISAPQEAQKIVNNFMKITPEQGKNLLVKISFANYKNELARKGFSHFILVSPSKSLFFNVENIDKVQQFVSYSAPEWKDIRNGAAAQISLL